jgi:hypothetical protein
MINVCRAAFPRPALQVPEVEGVIEQLSLVQPGGMSWRQTGVPPTATGSEILRRRLADVAGTAVMDQVNPPKATAVLSELFQGWDVVISVIGLQADCFHLTRMDDQEIQDVHRTMPDVVELLLLRR